MESTRYLLKVAENFPYIWTPELADKDGFREISADELKRVLEGEVIFAPHKESEVRVKDDFPNELTSENTSTVIDKSDEPKPVETKEASKQALLETHLASVNSEDNVDDLREYMDAFFDHKIHPMAKLPKAKERAAEFLKRHYKEE